MCLWRSLMFRSLLKWFQQHTEQTGEMYLFPDLLIINTIAINTISQRSVGHIKKLSKAVRERSFFFFLNVPKPMELTYVIYRIHSLFHKRAARLYERIKLMYKENLTLCLGIYNMISFICQWNMKETETKNKEWNWDSSCVLHLPWFLNCLFLSVSAEEEHLESWSEGVRPGEEILGVPLTPMEPVRALRKRSPHTWKDSDGHGRAHTDRSHPHAPQHTLARVTRTHTHEHTLSTFEVFPACSQAQSGGGGLSFSFLFCFLILFIYRLFLVKPRDIGENGWVNMGVIPALPRQGAPAHHYISYCRCWRWRSARGCLGCPLRKPSSY